VTPAPGASQSPIGAAGVAAVARLIAHAGLVEAFGHVSARAGDGAFLLTSTAPLSAQREDGIHHVAGSGDVAAGTEGVPLERYLHAAIYAARPDVGAICRTHSPSAVVWGARGAVPPLVHGLGALGGTVVFGDEIDLVADGAAGAAAAAALGTADCLIARGNGVVTTGATLAEAATRAWFLEERCRVADAAGAGAVAIGDDHPRHRHVAVEYPRAWRWLEETFGSGRAG